MVPPAVKNTFIGLGITGAVMSGGATLWQQAQAVRNLPVASHMEKAAIFQAVGTQLMKMVSGPIAYAALPFALKTAETMINHWKKRYEPIIPDQANFELFNQSKNVLWDSNDSFSDANGSYVPSKKAQTFIEQMHSKLLYNSVKGETFQFGLALHGPGGTGKSHLSDELGQKFYETMKDTHYIARFKITPAAFQDHGPEKLNDILQSLKTVAENGNGKKVACILQFEEMDAVFRSPDQQKQFQTFIDQLKENNISSCHIGTMNDMSFLRDGSGQANTGFIRAL